jgi:hypothetical protein
VSPSLPAFLFLAIGLPFIVVAVIVSIHARRKAAKLESNGIEAAFAPIDLPSAGFLLRRFSTPERAFLLQRTTVLLTFSGAVTYAFLVLMCAGLLPWSIAHFGLPGGGPLSIWHSYLFMITTNTAAYGIFSIMYGFIASAEISMPATANFPRTRPIPRSLIFWGRIAPTLIMMLAAFALAVGLSLFVLAVCHGPIYNHLSDPACQPRIPLDHDAIEDLALTLQTSAPRLFLSIATTLMLNFSVIVAAFVLPFRQGRNRAISAVVLVGFIIMSQSFLSIFHEAAPSLARFFFLYSRLGPPPPYAYATVPVTLSVVLLLLASFFSNRLET